MPKKIQLLHQSGFDRNQLNNFLQKKYEKQREEEEEVQDKQQEEDTAKAETTGEFEEVEQQDSEQKVFDNS